MTEPAIELIHVFFSVFLIHEILDEIIITASVDILSGSPHTPHATMSGIVVLTLTHVHHT